MSAVRKGRNFELYMHKILKKILGDVHVQKWSGTKYDFGDLYTSKLLFDCKHINGYSEGDVRQWYKKLTREGKQSNRIPVLIVRKTRSQTINIMFDIKYLPKCSYNGLTRFFWDEGIELLKIMGGDKDETTS